LSEGTLEQLCQLYGLSLIERSLADYYEDNFVSPAQADMLRAQIRALLQAIRPNAIGLVDAFDISDNALRSCLGRYDGT
jgi:acyl-CoA oxidase